MGDFGERIGCVEPRVMWMSRRVCMFMSALVTMFGLLGLIIPRANKIQGREDQPRDHGGGRSYK